MLLEIKEAQQALKACLVRADARLPPHIVLSVGAACFPKNAG
jgi:hypothetical protein